MMIGAWWRIDYEAHGSSVFYNLKFVYKLVHALPRYSVCFPILDSSGGLRILIRKEICCTPSQIHFDDALGKSPI
jgi:hypothetical protein